MKRHNLVLVLAAACSSVLLIAGSSFIVEKKKKTGTSAAQLKQACCRELADQLKMLPKILRLLADLQELGIEHSEGIIDGAKDGFFATADKQLLELCLGKLENFSGTLEQVCFLLEQQAAFLRKPEAGIKKS